MQTISQILLMLIILLWLARFRNMSHIFEYRMIFSLIPS